jgi:peptide deformylase
MALLHILEYPDPRLRLKAHPVERVDAAVRRLADDMLETMYAAPGVGLSAIQVNVAKRLIVMDISEHGQTPICLINPVIVGRSGAATMDEGCLSVPGVFDGVERAARVRVAALDRDGAAIELEAEGLLAACIQHEIDHLDGLLFIDHLADSKRRRIDRRFEPPRSRAM